MACKEAKLTAYLTAITTERAARISTLTDIIAQDATEAAAVTRCENPPGPRKERRDFAAATGGVPACTGDNCCGSAKGNVNGAVLTVEVCQPKTTETWTYTAPRAPMDTTAAADRTTDATFVFRCIETARNLAAPLAALAAAAYCAA